MRFELSSLGLQGLCSVTTQTGPSTVHLRSIFPLYSTACPLNYIRHWRKITHLNRPLVPTLLVCIIWVAIFTGYFGKYGILQEINAKSHFKNKTRSKKLSVANKLIDHGKNLNTFCNVKFIPFYSSIKNWVSKEC